MKKLLAIILSITMLLSMGTVAFADGVDGPMQKAKLTVGITEFAPFEYYEGDELKGFDIDLMNYIDAPETLCFRSIIISKILA